MLNEFVMKFFEVWSENSKNYKYNLVHKNLLHEIARDGGGQFSIRHSRGAIWQPCVGLVGGLIFKKFFSFDWTISQFWHFIWTRWTKKNYIKLYGSLKKGSEFIIDIE